MGQNRHGAVCAQWDGDSPYPPSENCLRTASVWEIMQETGRYLAPMWQESNFWQASLHCLLAANTKQTCQLFEQFCWNIILGVYVHTPPSSEQFFSQSIHPSAIHYLKRDVWTWHGGDNASQAVWGAVVWHGDTAGRPATHPSTAPGCPSLHPSPHPSGPVLQGHPVLPLPIPVQLLADAKWYLQPPKASAWDAKGVTQIGPGPCGRWAQWEPGWARVRYGQVCPGRAGTATFYHDIQVFPLPALSLAVKTELDHKYSNLKQEKIKRKQEKRALMSIAAPHSLLFPYSQLLLPLLLPAGAHASSDTQENILFRVKG